MIKHAFRRAILTALLLISPVAAHAAKAIPVPPQFYVLDEPRALSPGTKRELESLLVEHDRVTGEQFLIAIFNSLDDEDVVDYTNRVFKEWKIGQRGKDNGVLLTLYWKERKTRIEVGYGLEPLLTDAKSKEVLTEILRPELRAGNPDRGLMLSTVEILKILESPLIQSGRTQQSLNSPSMRRAEARAQAKGGTSWLPWIILGGVLCVIVFNLLTSADAHFTRSGWQRTRPFRNRSRGGGWWTSGPFGGGWGGGGGGGWPTAGGGGGGIFSGGGGSSGGGGASGDW